MVMDPFNIIVFVALIIFLYGIFSRISEQSVISAPMVFAGIGVVTSPLGLNLIQVHVESEVISLIAQLALISILFSDASSID